jgi:Ca2+:H+ antiporter
LATGVVDATFGNAVEMIISFIALINKQTSLVQYALLGAMLVKALLVRLK